MPLRRRGIRWIVVLEPDFDRKVLQAVTAFCEEH